MRRPILMLSTPRSGSDWFANDVLRWAAPDYFREYYNPVCNYGRTATLRLAFGSEVDWEGIAVPWECQDDVCEYVHQLTWGREPFKYLYVKENYAAFKIGFLQKYFDCFALVGHRRQVFPGGSRPRWTEFWWARYFRSLEFNRELIDEEVGRLVDRALAGPLDLHRKMVAAQVIATYQTLRECLRYQIPVVEYRRLLELPTSPDVAEYLDPRLPAPLMAEGLADRVVSTRRAADKAGPYEALGVEPFARELIALIPPELNTYFQ